MENWKIHETLKKVNGIVGLGYGSGYTQQLAAYVDLNSSGVWRESTYSDSHLFSEYLETTLGDIWEHGMITRHI